MAGNEIGITSLGYLYVKVRFSIHLFDWANAISWAWAQPNVHDTS